MKKQLISILALMLCLCTVFVMASCGGNKTTDESGSDGINESLNDGNNNGAINGDETFDAGDGLEDVDIKTAEDIFAQMKTAYKATLDYKNAYSISIDWIENEVTTGSGKGAESSTGKYSTKETITADPATGKLAIVLNSEDSDGKSVAKTKIFNSGSKNYIYSSSTAEDYESYNLLSDYGFASQKSAMLLGNYFGAGSHFTESFGEPFSAASVSNLKTTYTTVLNEVKAAEKARYEAMGYTVKQINATSDIIFNTADGVNIFKRTITVTCNLQNESGTTQKNITVESLLKSKDGKILSFVSNTTRSELDKIGADYETQTNTTSALSYEFSYALDNSAYNAIKTTVPATGVETAFDDFGAPLTLVINGNEVAIDVIGQVTAEQSIADVLTRTLNELFADANIEYDGKWYTDALCSKELNISSITSVEKLAGLKKLYNNSFKISSGNALFIDSGKVTADIPTNYTIVFGKSVIDSVLDVEIIVREANEESFSHRVSYEPTNGYDTTIKLNDKTLKYDANPEISDFQEESAGEFFHEFVFENGKIYFIKRSYVATKSYFTLDSFYVQF